MALIRKKMTPPNQGVVKAVPIVAKATVELPVLAKKVITVPKPIIKTAPVVKSVVKPVAPTAPAVQHRRKVHPDFIPLTEKEDAVEKPINLSKSSENDILELIDKRQRQIIVHSVIYYRLDFNLITDETWNKWAKELVKLQADYPEIAVKSVFWKDMEDFDASTGFHLANHIWGMKVAPALLANHNNWENKSLERANAREHERRTEHERARNENTKRMA